VILFLAVGFVLQSFVDWDKTMPTAALAGIVIALLIPDSKTSCAIKTEQPANSTPANPKDASGVSSVAGTD